MIREWTPMDAKEREWRGGATFVRRLENWLIRMRNRLILGLLIFLGGSLWSLRTAEASPTALQIQDVQANRTTVGLYEKFELTFQVQGSVASNPYFPYDLNPPPGVPRGVGISVSAIFTAPDGQQLEQPGFLYQPYERRCVVENQFVSACPSNGEEWLYPQGEAVWKVRFAPQQLGTWRYRLRAVDASGSAESGEGTFTVVPSSDPHNHGFIRIGRNDPGYFEYADGSPFIGVGHGEGFEGRRFTYDAAERLRQLGEARVNFIRIWMSGSSIYMAPWNPWHSHHLPSEGGYLNPASLTYSEADGGNLFSLRLWEYPDPAVESRRNPCMFQGFTNNIAVKPNTTYELSVRLKTSGISGPRRSGYDYGFTVRKGGWLGESCSDPSQTSANSTRLFEYVRDTGGNWITRSYWFTTGSNEVFLDNLYLILENTTGGQVFIDQVSLREVLNGMPSGPELLRKNRFAYHLYFDQQPSWQWDFVFAEAERWGVTIRPVVLEKNDWIANHLDQNGAPIGEYYEFDNNRFYAALNTAVRRYHEYFWRYLIARWGYSRAVHSWELINEGDPYNGHHYEMANAFGRFMRQNDPHRHLVTTSNWHSLPIAEFWGNPQYEAVDYADIHEYACCGNRYAGWANTISSPLAFEDRPAYVLGGIGHSVRIAGNPRFNNAGDTPRSLVIRGRGEWVLRYQMKAEAFSGSCDFGIPDSLAGPRLLWILDNARSSVVPPPGESGKAFLCTAPAGSYDWRTFDSRFTHNGNSAPLSERIILDDDQLHSLIIAFQNGFGQSGNAWIDNVELIAPDGRKVYLNGEFDLTPIIHDTAHLTAALSQQVGGRTLSGAGKPLTRGEVALGDDNDYRGDSEHDQSRDTEGVWLHHFIWAQINPGGLYELYWDATNIKRYNLYHHFKSFRDFMDDIPLNNGRYQDVQAVASDPNLRVLGQVDRLFARGHLWIHNRQHTWRKVVDSVSIPSVESATVTVPNLPEGSYRVIWWDTWQGKPIRSQAVVGSGNSLTLALPGPLSRDIAVKFEPLDGSIRKVFLPLLFKR